MLNRRHALISASGVLLAGGSSQLNAATEETDAHVSTLTPAATAPASGQTREMMNAAAACLECASVCDHLLSESTTAEITRRLAADSRDICTVTATLLSRQAPMSPAICQSCRDACRRLAAVASTARRPALRCAEACRKVLDAA